MSILSILPRSAGTLCHHTVTDQGSWPSPINRNWLEARQEIQPRLYWWSLLYSGKPEQVTGSLACSLPEGGLPCSLHWVRVGVCPEESMATHSSILVWKIPMDRGAWQAAVHGVAKSQTRRATKHSTAQGCVHGSGRRDGLGGLPSLWWCWEQGACSVPILLLLQALQNGSCVYGFGGFGGIFLVSLYISFRISPNCTSTQLFLVSYCFFVFCCWRKGVSSYKQKVPGPSLSQPLSINTRWMTILNLTYFLGNCW